MDDCAPDQLPDTVELCPQPTMRISRLSGAAHYVSKWCGPYDDALKRKVVKESKSFARVAKEINDEFGTRFTRNSAIGRAYRLGWKSANPPSVIHQFALRRTKSERGDNLIARHMELHRRAKPGPKPRPRITCEEIQPLHLNLDQLCAGQCRWPYGDGPYTFCGLKEYARSYCADHYLRSIQASEAA